MKKLKNQSKKKLIKLIKSQNNKINELNIIKAHYENIIQNNFTDLTSHSNSRTTLQRGYVEE